MKFYLIVLLIFIHPVCMAQEWMAEVMLGASTYNGDLTQREISLRRVRPAATLNLKYNSGDFINLRAGLSYARLSASDKNNPDPGLQSRNLSFQTNIYELNLCAEINIMDPLTYYAYPYLFGGVGVFRFNPYTHDDENQKVFLQPLGTEGQGLREFPDRKKYSLYQVCFPVGGGFKINVDNRYEIGIEFGYRILLTDYLDDVSKTYVSLKALQEANGPKAIELSYRKKAPFTEEGEKRGNSRVKDSYFFSGIKIAIPIGGERTNY
ncbi:MAG: hypothetical protein H7258_15255 [Ferruginibacter sp.]|nr:hypothetical protein [Ferruginibacter sp.]